MTDGVGPAAAAPERPVVACYCATFLKPEMLHIYRQITGLTRFRPVVIAQKREEAERFPFGAINVVGKPPSHWLRRIWFKDVMNAPWQISRDENETLLRLLERANAALLHIYFGHIAVHLLPLIRSWRNPIVVSFHGADAMVDMEKSAFRYATVQMLNKVRLVLVRSSSLRNAIVRLGCPEDKIRIHHTGIPLGEFPFRERVWPEDGSWRLVQACRLIDKKGLRTSLRAFARFAKEYPNATFTIAGDGPQLMDLQQLTANLELPDKVVFAGMLTQRELREIYESSHLFLHPSRLASDGNMEGVPNSMLEAMSSGLPVFATTHGGIPEAIEHNVSGILVSERDHASLANALLHAARNPDELTRLARAAADTVARNFEQTTQVRQLEEFYLEALT